MGINLYTINYDIFKTKAPSIIYNKSYYQNKENLKVCYEILINNSTNI